MNDSLTLADANDVHNLNLLKKTSVAICASSDDFTISRLSSITFIDLFLFIFLCSQTPCGEPNYQIWVTMNPNVLMFLCLVSLVSRDDDLRYLL